MFPCPKESLSEDSYRLCSIKERPTPDEFEQAYCVRIGRHARTERHQALHGSLREAESVDVKPHRSTMVDEVNIIDPMRLDLQFLLCKPTCRDYVGPTSPPALDMLEWWRFVVSPLVEFPLEDGAVIYVELPEEDAGVAPVGVDPSEIMRKASVTFDQALTQMGSIANSVSNVIRNLAHSPSEFELHFAIKLSADVGAIVAAAGAESTFELVVKWQKNAEPPLRGNA